MISYLYFFL